ncbi:vitamin K epoxide reductase complex subunit 1 [Anastrepha ludens]|uniref:vitamin K epoxide reductase complex subunit 1 n=1 Tax=Anastrepha ludens TaxID=28586 RepID=UPI0023B06A6E|nr:vitamin K epoxide reductase complex subunit 1 [Anastrepha ludens]
MGQLFWRFRGCCLVGLLLSAYATYVELRAEKDADYVALCDLSPKVSCTAVFTSSYGRGFGLTKYVTSWNPPNGLLGIAFYIILLLLTPPRHRLLSLLQLFLCFVSNLLSIYLAYLLYFVLEDFCVVCVSIYVVNFVCLWESSKISQQIGSRGFKAHSKAQNGSNKNN